MEVVNKLIRGVEEFPTLPTIYTALSEVMSNPYSTATDAANIIASDQSSASKILRSANSSIYGLKTKIETISDAIFYIGFNEVKNLILAMSIIDLFGKTKILKDFNPVDLWKHSIAVGVITRILGTATGAKNIENYFVTGILHDIGKLLFIKNIEQEFADTLDYAARENVTIREAETAVLGITHNVAGELIAEKWKLPASIKIAIRYHYTGVTPDGFDHLTSCVHLANIVARIMELGDPGDILVPEPNFTIWDQIDFVKNPFTTYLPKINLDFESSMNLFSL